MQSSTKVMVVCLKDIILSTGKFIPKDYKEIMTLAETLLLCQDLGDEIMKEHFQLYSKNPNVKNGWHKMTYKPKGGNNG